MKEFTGVRLLALRERVQAYNEPLEQPHIIEQQEIKQSPMKKHVRRMFSRGEKIIFVLFLATVTFFGSVLLMNHSSIQATNKEIHQMNKQIDQVTKENEGLKILINEKSSHERIFQKAQERGLNIGEGSVKVVPGK